MPTVLLIRHGESQGNIGLPTATPQDIELTERGFVQAEQIAAFLATHSRPDLIITSPYQRTKQTAAPTLAYFPTVAKTEWPVHEFTYLSLKSPKKTTMQDRQPLVHRYWEQCRPYFIDGPTSESFEQFIKRVQAIMLCLKNTPYQTVAVFSHEQFICALLWLAERRWVNISHDEMREFKAFLKGHPIPNGAIVKIADSQESHQYELITSHLEIPLVALPAGY